MEAGGEITDEVKAELLELGLAEEQIEMFSNMQSGRGNRQPGEQGGQPGGFSGPGGGMPGGGEPPEGNMPGGGGLSNLNTPPQSGINMDYALAIARLLVLLAAAIAFVARPRKDMVL
jgi:hypothetical protein